jgi:hypothetical protein
MRDPANRDAEMIVRTTEAAMEVHGVSSLRRTKPAWLGHDASQMVPVVVTMHTSAALNPSSSATNSSAPRPRRAGDPTACLPTHGSIRCPRTAESARR